MAKRKKRKIKVEEVKLPPKKVKLPPKKILKEKKKGLGKITKIVQRFGLTRRKALVIFLLSFFFISFSFWLFTKDLPNPANLTSQEIPLTTRIYDRNGELLYRIFAERNRSLVELEKLPDYIKWSTIAIEDQDFYKHKGLDPRGIARAAERILFGRQLQGGSTITQQLVKNVFLTPERTIPRKVKELYLAIRTEFAYSKDEILELYLNNVPYGGTAWGIQAAAETYFAKDAQDLTLAEATLLAGLPAAPSRFSPISNPKGAKERQQAVLRRMVEDGYISEDEANIAEVEELNFTPLKNNIKAPHFVFFVKEILAQKYGEGVVEQGGLQVYTSLDLETQENAEDVVKKRIDALEDLRVSNGAALVTKPKTGEILAMVGSKDYFDKSIDGNVNITTAQRQPGSSIKPINYASALEKQIITPATVIVDLPITFKNPGAPPYKPVNYDGKFHGPVTARYALGNSYNIPAVKVLAKQGVSEMIKLARFMGITTFEDEERYGLSLTLGGGEIKMVEMATAFGVFANTGEKVDLLPILRVEDSTGKILDEAKPQEGKRVLSEETSFLISHILLDNNARTAAFGPSSYLNISGQAVSVKTGTTDDKRDNWTIGFTPSYLVATWVGNNNNTPMHPTLSSGITGASPIWNEIMRDVLKGKVPEYPKQPDGIVATEICSQTGGLATGDCAKRTEYFIKGTQPTEAVFAKSKVWVDIKTGKVVEPGTPESEEKEVPIVTDILETNQAYCVGCQFQLAGPPEEQQNQPQVQETSITTTSSSDQSQSQSSSD